MPHASMPASVNQIRTFQRAYVASLSDLHDLNAQIPYVPHGRLIEKKLLEVENQFLAWCQIQREKLEKEHTPVE